MGELKAGIRVHEVPSQWAARERTVLVGLDSETHPTAQTSELDVLAAPYHTPSAEAIAPDAEVSFHELPSQCRKRGVLAEELPL